MKSHSVTANLPPSLEQVHQAMGALFGKTLMYNITVATIEDGCTMIRIYATPMEGVKDE